MAIGFNQVPSDSRVPFFYVEIDSSRAGAGVPDFRSLIIGQRLAVGRVAAGMPTQIATEADAASAFGAGSMLALMVAAYRRTDPTGELWCVALDDASSGAAETKTVTVASAGTAAGTIALYVNGRRIPVTLAGAAATSAIAAAIVTAINAKTGLPCTATASAAAVTVTARNKGAAGDLDIRFNYQPDDRFPAGVAITVADGVAGAGDPGIAGALTAIGDEQYNVIATPYTADADITALETELAARWGPTQQIDGVGIAAFKGAAGTAGQATTYGNARNSRHVSVMDAGKTPTPQYEWAATIAGAVAASASVDPARPFQTLPLPGCLPAPVGERRTFTERRTLLTDGIATHSVDRDGTVRIERLITTYQTLNGVPDVAYLDLNTPLTLGYIRADFRNTIRRKYARHKLADDGTRIGAGQAVITPSVGRAEAIARFRAWEEAGLVEGAEQFKEDLICERNAGDRNRLDWLLSPNLVNQFRVGGVKISYLL